MADKRNLNTTEKRMIFDLDNLGMSREHLAEFFDIADKTVLRYVREKRNELGNISYSLEETSAVMTRYLLASLARNMHKLTEEQKLRFLPDLLKVKDGVKDTEDLGIHMYTPRKKKIRDDEVIIIED